MSTLKADKSLLLLTAEPNTRRLLYRAIRGLSEGEYAVTFVKKRNGASGGQRGYYWGYLIPEVGKLIGLDKEATDKALCALFLASPCKVADEVITVVRSLSDLDPTEASNYFSEIRMWTWAKYKRRLAEPDALLRKKRVSKAK